jgi:ribosomal protein S4E
MHVPVHSVGGEAAVADGVRCIVVGGTHRGKSGVVTDIKAGKTGHTSLTVVQPSGERFKTLARNIVVVR